MVRSGIVSTVLLRVFNKEGAGHRRGPQKGAGPSAHRGDSQKGIDRRKEMNQSDRRIYLIKSVATVPVRRYRMVQRSSADFSVLL
mgnify:CR=1 FL=1